MQSSNLVGTYPDYINGYIQLVKNEPLKPLLSEQLQYAYDFFEVIPPEKQSYSYAEGKWTVKEVLQHIIDTERILSYRALAFARKDPQTLPPFDETEYGKNAEAERRDWKNLVDEFKAVRTSTNYLFNSFSEDQLASVGTANKYQISVKALGYFITGHLRHHLNILKERYGL